MTDPNTYGPTIAEALAKILMADRYEDESFLVALGLDPDMTVDQLHRRLAIAERAEACIIYDPCATLLDHIVNGDDG